MNFTLAEEQVLLRDSARAFLRKHLPQNKIRIGWESPQGYDDEVWCRAVSDLGWSRAFIDQQYGGLGLGMVEAVLLMEEMGRFLFCPPFLASVFLCAGLLEGCDSQTAKDQWLPQMASGALTGTAAIGEIDAGYRQIDQGFELSGKAHYVLEGAQADLIIIAANASSGETGLFVIPAASEGLVRQSLPGMDRCLRRAHISFDRLYVPQHNRLAARDVTALLNKIKDRALIALAAQQMGGAAQCLDLTINHVSQRVQFGRAIGSFQAVKHKCADMMVEIEAARSAVYYAAALADQSDDTLPQAAALAKVYCSDVFFNCAAEAMQLHGGIGFTWDYVLHLYFKHAHATQLYWGTPDLHRAHLADMIGFDEMSVLWI